jgi:hypothetical protein
MKAKVRVAKGKSIPKGKLKKIKEKAGSSNAGKYKDVSPKEFAGAAGGASKYSFPINSLKRAKSALKLAHNAPKPSGIKKAVKAKYPNLGKTHGKKEND